MNHIQFGAIAAVAAFASAANAGMLFGVATFSPFGTQSLYSIDPSTGAATVIGSTGLRQISGLDFDAANNRLMALTSGGDQYAISTATGASTLVVDAAFSVPEGSVAFENGSAYAPIFDNANVWNGSSWSSLGASGLGAADISGLDFAGTRLLGLALNGTGTDQLVEFNTTTGAATIVGSTGTNASTVAGLAFDFEGRSLFMTDGSSLYTLNTSTGAATLVGSHGGVAGFSGLAYVPAPGLVGFVAAGSVLGFGRRRR
jgi:hypothetical protein